MSAYFVLGVFRDEAASLFRSFHGHAKGRMVSQTSSDLIHWECSPKEFHVPAADYYERRRDPFVFWIPERKRYGCVMTTWIKGRPKPKGGGISLATSPDLKQWTDHGIVLDLADQDEPECPQMFQIGARFTFRSPGKTPFHLDFAPLGFVEFAKDEIRICDAGGTCWSKLDVCWRGDTAVSVFVEDDRVEVFADDRYSLCARLPGADQPLKVSWPGASPRDIRTTLLQSQQKKGRR
jgi:hypothetical protein